MILFLLTRPSRDVTANGQITAVAGAISTHTPLAGRDIRTESGRVWNIRFLLTRPSRDVTRRSETDPGARVYFYSHAPRGT